MQDKLKQKEPELWPERVYQWGTSEAMNSQHSDLLLLRKLLLEEAVEEISHSKIHRCCHPLGCTVNTVTVNTCLPSLNNCIACIP